MTSELFSNGIYMFMTLFVCMYVCEYRGLCVRSVVVHGRAWWNASPNSGCHAISTALVHKHSLTSPSPA